jgi:hypothetical protein
MKNWTLSSELHYQIGLRKKLGQLGQSGGCQLQGHSSGHLLTLSELPNTDVAVKLLSSRNKKGTTERLHYTMPDY